MGSRILVPSLVTCVEGLLGFGALMIAFGSVPTSARLMFTAAGLWCIGRAIHRIFGGGGLDSISSGAASALIEGPQLTIVGELRIGVNRAAKITIVSNSLWLSRPVFVEAIPKPL